MNMQLEHDNIGMKIRFEKTAWQSGKESPDWGYAFAYANLADNHLKISAGRLGDSPWSTGGPELWKELDTTIGIRTEIKPIKGLNFGFVLNKWNGGEVTGNRTLIEVLKESVLGLSYENDYFAIRGAFRLDSDLDGDDEEAVYRVEERAIQKVLPGFQIFANGYYKGINASEGGRGGSEPEFDSINWLYAQYDPLNFIAQLRFGYELVPDRQILTIRPTYYHKFFEGLLEVGASFTYAQDFGDNKFYKDSPYFYINFEPKVKFIFGGFYTELVYAYHNEYVLVRTDTLGITHWINLRMVYTF
jgi:hypothetical protein